MTITFSDETCAGTWRAYLLLKRQFRTKDELKAFGMALLTF